MELSLELEFDSELHQPPALPQRGPAKILHGLLVRHAIDEVHRQPRITSREEGKGVVREVVHRKAELKLLVFAEFPVLEERQVVVLESGLLHVWHLVGTVDTR